MWLGVLVAVLPLLGFPATWKSVVYFISGALIAVNSYQLSKHKIMRSRRAERKHRENITSPTPESFSVPQMPFLTLKGSKRKAFSEIKNLDVRIEEDELFPLSKKIILEFELDSGSYATTFLEGFFVLR